MAACRRTMKDLKDIRAGPLPRYPIIKVDDANVLEWEVLLQPTTPPFSQGAFLNLSLNFPPQFPFLAPRIRFKTKIYHPSVDDEGKVCLMIILQENWKPAATIQFAESCGPKPLDRHRLTENTGQHHLTETASPKSLDRSCLTESARVESGVSRIA
ncbi:ubiquitin-conjugating enzyme E2 L5-like [Galendromus occidentalis]|uniref:Ubiquitin-conjugating enzyme E2 L5-like n=1 Tax=Galendromus occidentalis TaxID=34638 RepID=A0AAJ6QN93_9ACAR|nr:ubiquitin-conjugating enzyme E2 L5-like [Galendromus occidentalis]